MRVPGHRLLGRWRPTRDVDVTAGRLQLGAALHDGSRPFNATEEAVQRLLLVFQELAGNAVRHGRPPIEVLVSAAGHGWLLEVSDTAGDAPPTPDPTRDTALGGLGLALVAELSDAHGWEPVGDGGKVVWARVDYLREEAPTSP